jgi:Pyruvate/2-oxoacid:ferredoxin oxidoreductase delta subunit
MNNSARRSVIVLGGTSEAQHAAHELATLGYGVTWVATDAWPNGELSVSEGVTLLRDAELVAFEGYVGAFAAQVRVTGQMQTIATEAIVIAIGNERYVDTALGIPLGPRALTASQLRRRLEERPFTGAAMPLRQARYLMLLDPTDLTRKEPAVEMLHLARDLRARWRCEVIVFYRDLLVDAMPLERLTREMRQQGIVFSRTDSMTATVDDQGVTVAAAEGPIRGDFIVAPEAVRPRADASALADLLKVRLGEDGYFQDVNIRQVRAGLSNRKGIYFAGRCHLDVDPIAALADATQVVASMDALLSTDPLQPDVGVAEVDRAKCIRCLTCARTCPHAAVEIVKDEDATAARVFELACWGCGACVANCPVQAISLAGQTMPAWMQPAEVAQ